MRRALDQVVVGLWVKVVALLLVAQSSCDNPELMSPDAVASGRQVDRPGQRPRRTWGHDVLPARGSLAG
jgi:hypothetical protein